MTNLTIFRDFYETYALMLGEEAMVVSGLLIGLNIIDCNMVLKDDDDLDRPVSIMSFCLLFEQKFRHRRFMY